MFMDVFLVIVLLRTVALGLYGISSTCLHSVAQCASLADSSDLSVLSQPTIQCAALTALFQLLWPHIKAPHCSVARERHITQPT